MHLTQWLRYALQGNHKNNSQLNTQLVNPKRLSTLSMKKILDSCFKYFSLRKNWQNPEHGLSHKETKNFVKVYNQSQSSWYKDSSTWMLYLGKRLHLFGYLSFNATSLKARKRRKLVILIKVAYKWPQMTNRPYYFTFHETNLGMFSVRNTNELFHTLELSANHGIKISMRSVYS